jgi:predicted RNA binding protein YcfA (HicA-like mRNA interferase family)
MTKREKLIAKALNNPKGLSFQDFQQLLRSAGWMFEHQRGSHQIWRSLTGHRLSIQEGQAGKAKGYQVEQFIILYEREEDGNN